jgi:hypothetical protein
MVRVIFTECDLSLVRVAAAPDPLWRSPTFSIGCRPGSTPFSVRRRIVSPTN